MRKLPFIFALILPLAVFAETQPHDIIPGVHFGMPLIPARTALVRFQSSIAGTGTAKLRHHFITSTSIQPGKLMANDKLVPFGFVPSKGPIFNSLGILSVEQPAAGYESVRTAWADLKDIADSKFKRLGGPATFPELIEFGGVDKDIITDAYEADGMHVDLIVQCRNLPNQGTLYGALLNVAPATAAAK